MHLWFVPGECVPGTSSPTSNIFSAVTALNKFHFFQIHFMFLLSKKIFDVSSAHNDTSSSGYCVKKISTRDNSFHPPSLMPLTNILLVLGFIHFELVNNFPFLCLLWSWLYYYKIRTLIRNHLATKINHKLIFRTQLLSELIL